MRHDQYGARHFRELLNLGVILQEGHLEKALVYLLYSLKGIVSVLDSGPIIERILIHLEKTFEDQFGEHYHIQLLQGWRQLATPGFVIGIDSELQ